MIEIRYMNENEFFLEEVREGCLITREKKRVWYILLQLANELKRICEKNQLTYFLHAGSLLGAVRHQGFIPWDDDIDFVLPRKDFDKFLMIAEDEIRSPYYLQTPYNTSDMCTFGRIRLRLDGTTGVQYINELFERYHQGICIDILPLDEVSDNQSNLEGQQRKLDFYAGLFYLKKYGQKKYSLSRIGWGRIKTRFAYWSSQFMSYTFLQNKLYKFSVMYNKFSDNKRCIVNSEVFGSYRHTILEKKDYEKKIIVPFENSEFPIPAGFDRILKQYYGKDYMCFPPEDQRIGHHNPIIEIQEPYTDYLMHFQDIFKDVTGKKIIVFGAGEMLNHYLKYTRKKYRPIFVVDNDHKKWGKKVQELEICSPKRILEIDESEQYIIICSIYYKEIIKQLKSMNVKNYYIYVQNLEWL